MRISAGILLCAGLVRLAPLAAQSPILLGAGYITPPPLQVAPGQVITLYVSGTKTVLPAQASSLRASTIPLPASLGGFSVTVRQGSNSYSAPMIAVVQTPNCSDATNLTPQCVVTALTVQIPFELAQALNGPAPSGDLTVGDNGTESAHFAISLVWDRIHILTYCDQENMPPFVPLPCNALITHADGTTGPVVKAGETIVLYAYGFGLTGPAVKTGDATPIPAPVALGAPNVWVQFDFRPNAGPAMPPRPAGGTDPRVAFAGLTPGQVGLYQINVKLPDAFPSVPACTGAFSCGNVLECLVSSNLTIDIAASASFDSAAICVQPPTP